MKKMIMFLCLSLIALSLTASGTISVSQQQPINGSYSAEYGDLKVGDYIVRVLPCPECADDCFGWEVVDKILDNVYIVRCVVCGYEDVL
jgi:hypothetical protein